MSNSSNSSPAANKAGCDGFSPATEKRSAERVAIAGEVFVTSLDEAVTPFINPFPAQMQDVSMCGVSFLHSVPFNSARVAITFVEPDESYVDLMFRVVRTFKVETGQFVTAAALINQVGRAN